MRLNYKRLGDYIQPVNIRNLNLEVETLLGVSIRKVLMPSIANTIGTNMSRYKIIEKNQFAYGPVTSRNGDKISIALLEEHDKALVSQAYTVFEIIDNELLNAEYLMMWFRRPEFDRYARFKSHGSARETFDWEELEDTELPIPSIEKQNEIVKEYNTIVNRITLNETLNQKLEDTAQALYKHWFVDFNFPITKESCPELVSGSPELEGKPYKSSGGEMVYNEELDVEIPLGWEVKTVKDICRVINGRAYREGEYRKIGTPIIRIQNLSGGKKYLFSDLNLPDDKYVVGEELLFAWSATFGPYIWRGIKSIYHYHIWKLDCFNPSHKLFFYSYLKLVTSEVSGQGSGSIFRHITKALMESQLIICPSAKYTELYNSKAVKLFKYISIIEKESQQLQNLVAILQSKMSKIV